MYSVRPNVCSIRVDGCAFLLDGIKRESLISLTGIYMCNGRGHKKTSLCTCRSGDMVFVFGDGTCPKKSWLRV